MSGCLLHFPDDKWYWAFFKWACWTSICLLWKNVFSGFLSIFKSGCLVFLMLSCISSLYILDMDSFSDILFINNFSHSVGDILFLWYLPLLSRRFLVWYSLLFICAFVSLAWGDTAKDIQLRIILKSLFQFFFLGMLWFQMLLLSL